MADKKIIAVAGATGAQGGSLVRAIQRDADGEFRARAITRNAQSDAAQALAALGAEVVEADLSDSDSLDRAFRGAYGAYCVTFYWAHMSPELERALRGRWLNPQSGSGFSTWFGRRWRIRANGSHSATSACPP